MLSACALRGKKPEVPSGLNLAPAEVPERRSTPDAALTLKLVALLLILDLGAACNNSRQSRPANLASTAGTPIASPALDAASQTVADMKVSAIDLTAAYVSDAAAADKLYEGRLLEISGQVESILPDGPPPVGSLKDLSGQTLMFFQGQTVACVFAPEQKEAAAQLQSRQGVTVVGRVDRRYDSRVVLRDCAVKRVEQKPPETRKGANNY